jgi:predicted TIM-barrel fold metal-dependent hydrolase
VIDKLLFGSDFPYTDAADCIEALYSINQIAQGTNLPLIPREALRGIVERDTLALLGLADVTR